MFTNTVKDWAAVLRAAAGLIEAQGKKHVGSSFCSSDGLLEVYPKSGDCFCAGGAVGFAINQMGLDFRDDAAPFGTYATNSRKAPETVRCAVSAAIGMSYGDVAMWNDSIETTHADIVTGLRKAADLVDPPTRKGKTFSKAYQPTPEQRAKVMGHVFARRLLAVADKTEEKERAGKFRFAAWVGNEATPYQGKADISCGTSACALGWATTIPALRKKGLRLRCVSGAMYEPTCPGAIDTEGVSSILFGLTANEHNHMFTPGNMSHDGGKWVNPKHGLVDLPQTASGDMVAANIRRYVEAKYPKAYAKYIATKGKESA